MLLLELVTAGSLIFYYYSYIRVENNFSFFNLDLILSFTEIRSSKPQSFPRSRLILLKDMGKYDGSFHDFVSTIILDTLSISIYQHTTSTVLLQTISHPLSKKKKKFFIKKNSHTSVYLKYWKNIANKHKNIMKIEVETLA